MEPIDQTRFGDHNGNCFNACISSLTGIPIDDLPPYWEWPDSEWYYRYNKFLSDYGLQILVIQAGDKEIFNIINTYHIISGPGPRGCDHSVIGLNGEVVHDPHYQRTGLKEAKHWDFLVKSFK